MNDLLKTIKENVKSCPEMKVVVDSTGFYTFKTLYDSASKIAARLKKAGVGEGDFVTVELPRAKEYTAAMYGALLAGAAYAPLSPDYPEQRLEYIRNDCNAKVNITPRFLRGIEEEAPLTDEVDRAPDSPALLIYTSGSTGNPKGVLHTYRSVCASVDRDVDMEVLPEGSRVACGAPFTFIVSLLDIFRPMCARHTEYIMPYEAMKDPVLLSDFVYENEINSLFISPKMLKIFKQRGSSLKRVYTGSERVSGIYSEEYDIVVRYGQSECAGTLNFKIDKKYDNTPIGKPLKDVNAYILDEEGKTAQEGELCFSGYFASCYLGLKEQSEKTFIKNPFKDKDGFENMLRTGDIVKMGEDGNIIFLNRKDWMVKINGQRVEPSEIEAIIKNTEGVFDAAIKDFKNRYSQVYLTAFYVEKEPINAEDIKQEIAKKLPPYMIPAFFVKLDKLPVNANGKLDRSALKAPEAAAFRSEYAPPETDMQKAICKAIEEVLDIENVSVDDDFFSLGGDSIKSAMVASKCERYKITSADIFSGKTPRMIERLLIKKTEKKPRKKGDKNLKVYPLTPMERGMYLEQKLDESSTVYNLNIAFIISGTDVQTLKQAAQKVFMAHEALHSTYGEEGGLPVRIVLDAPPEAVVKEGLCYDEAMELVNSYAVPFNLNEGIPVIPFIYKLTDGRIVFHLAVHHIAFDGGSAQPFFEELIAAIGGEPVQPEAIDLSSLFEDALNYDNSKGMAFYKELFADGVPVNDMPVKAKRPKVHPNGDTEISFAFTTEQINAIDDAAKNYRITEFELLFSALSAALGKYTASEDVVLGIPTNMRPAGADRVIGMFVNTAPVRVKPVRNQTLTEYFRSVSEAVRNATYGASLPFEEVVSEFSNVRDESRNPIFDVSVNYHYLPEKYDDGKLSVELYSPLQKMSRDFGIVIVKDANSLKFTLQYSSELFDKMLVNNFTEQFKNTLKLICDGVSTVRDALALPKAQLEQMHAFSTEATAEVPFNLLHKMFENSVSEHPDKTAVIAKGESYTYKELDDKANIIANELIKSGVKAGDSVTLLLPRRIYYFAALFGVNKAGAAFIPCDPDYPADRINHIINDSEAAFIITTDDKMGDYPADKAININALLNGKNTSNPNLCMTGKELAYMIYTSGSTGVPKGVMLRHESICNYLYAHPANIQMHKIKEDVQNYISVTTVSFDMSFKEHTAALINGKTLVFAAEDEMNDPRALAALMKEYAVDCINATPSRLMQYMEYAPFKQELKNCKLIMSGGEAYPIALRDELKIAAPEAMIVNTYGPTEITVSSNAGDLTDAEYVTVGRPLLNYEEYIVDKFGDIAPLGVIGELYIGGIGVADGYKNLKEKTEKAFVNFMGKRFYRSGDYAKWDKNGFVQILGRLDNQVKLRGLRIELGEIEGLIAKQPYIKKAVVVIKKISGQENLCAYFTAEKEIDIDELRAELKKHLTHYMVPSAYLQMSEMPVTANGKTDIKNLPEPVPAAANDYVPPENETEEFFCEVFQKALKLDKVGATDDFFEMGGSSLVVTSVVVAASEKGLDLTYADVFKYTTPKALAALFTEHKDDKHTGALYDFKDYDYTEINKLLKNNTVEAFTNGEMRELGNVLITGTTGYMGAHLLAGFLDSEKGSAYCLVRKGQFKSAKARLKSMMFYYFDQKYVEDMETRVEVLDGDVTDYKYFEQFEKFDINTIFNCAANVKHFSSGTDIEDINVGGVVNCIKLALKLDARFINFSTISVGGTTEDLESLERQELDEQAFYFGQDLDNKYISSKLMGERMVLEAIVNDGLDGKVIRVGTLSAREADGEFQINFLTNNFMGRLRSYNLLGCFPYSMIENQACMGPIDTSCDAFLRLAKTPRECCMFNAVNNHTLPLGDIIRQMNKNGMNIKFVEYADFIKALKKAQQDPEKAAILSSMTAYMGHSSEKQAITVPFAAHYTTQILARLGFFWNASNEKYVSHFINALRGFVFFDTDNLYR